MSLALSELENRRVRAPSEGCPQTGFSRGEEKGGGSGPTRPAAETIPR